MYKIEQYEIHVQTYKVEADSEAEAIVKLFDADGEAVDGSLEHVEVCEDRGLPANEYEELVKELRSLGVSIGEDVIPSIRSIVRGGRS